MPESLCQNFPKLLALPRYKQYYEDPVRSAVHTTLDEFSLFRLPLHYMLEPIFVWTWNENARTKQKQKTNGNRAIWLVCRTDTNARGLWLVKLALRWKNFMPENFLEINRYFDLTSYCNTIGQSNNAFSILGFSLAGKRRVHVFDLFISWLINRRALTETIFQGHRKVALSKRNNKYMYMCMCI